MPIPLPEMYADLAAINRDAVRLEKICALIQEFISDCGPENRSSFQVDLMRWQAVLADCRRVRTKIMAHIEKVDPPKQ